MFDQNLIGRTGNERFYDIERSQLRLFCQAIGETNPIFWDKAAAVAAGYPDCPLTPSFGVSLNRLAPEDGNLILDVFGADYGRRMHAEQSFEYHRPLYAGDRVRLLSKVGDIYHKKGGALEFAVIETTIYNQQGQLCITTRMTVVLRH